jgi:hypothetical protein
VVGVSDLDPPSAIGLSCFGQPQIIGVEEFRVAVGPNRSQFATLPPGIVFAADGSNGILHRLYLINLSDVFLR